MKCGHCSADVPPQWVHALNTNTCPSCGGTLMSDTEVHLLSELREAMNDMPNNPEGIAGWLLTHYQLVKTGTAEAANFHQPMVHGSGVPGHVQQMTKNGTPVQRSAQPESPVATINKFLARANVKPKSRSEMEAALASANSGDGGNAALIAAWNAPDDAGAGGDEPMDSQVAVYANALAGGGGGMGGGMDDGDAAQEAIINAFSGMGPGGQGRPTGADTLAAIKAMQRKQVNSEMRATGSVGKISRAG